jgi:hypothetical protein
MENNNSTLNTTPAPIDQRMAILVLDIRNFIDLVKSEPVSQARLTDNNYQRQDNLDYLLAISG